jgi:hypothetical protein
MNETIEVFTVYHRNTKPQLFFLLFFILTHKSQKILVFSELRVILNVYFKTKERDIVHITNNNAGLLSLTTMEVER